MVWVHSCRLATQKMTHVAPFRDTRELELNVQVMPWGINGVSICFYMFLLFCWIAEYKSKLIKVIFVFCSQSLLWSNPGAQHCVIQLYSVGYVIGKRLCATRYWSDGAPFISTMRPSCRRHRDLMGNVLFWRWSIAIWCEKPLTPDICNFIWPDVIGLNA